MFEDFFDQIHKELGPLNPFWFEELTAKACRDDEGPDISKDEEEEIKAPEISSLDTQLFSTPKIFKQHFHSPDSIRNEDSPYEVTNGLDSSPCLFGSGKENSCGQSREGFGLLDTPKRPLIHSVNQISRSLGAQINPDLSWTSSFNTPSSLTPTLMLPKTEDRPSSSSCLKDKEAIFVRKLFPSLSKGTESTETSSKRAVKHDETFQTDAVVNTVRSPEASLGASSLWKQKVPSAIEDGDVRTTVQSVLDGAEDVLSIFFSNATSALRKVKSQERNRKKANCSKDVNSTLEQDKEPEETLMGDETQTADVETKSPLTNNDVMQWTPLNLSDSSLNEGPSLALPFINSHNTVVSGEPNAGSSYSCAAGRSQSFFNSVERLRSCPDAEGTQQQKSLLDRSPVFMLNRKPRRFVYQVPSSDVSNAGINHKTSVCLEKTVTENPSEEKVSSVLHESSFVSEDAANPQTLQQPTASYLDEGLDMTQLSKAFAEDFTQELTSGGLVDTHLWSDQNDLSSSAVTTHIEKARQVKPEAEFEQTKEDFINQQGILGNRDDNYTLAEVPVDSANESTVVLSTFEISRDSGCPTTFSDLDGTSASKDIFSGFKTASNRSISISHEAIMSAKASLHEAVGDRLIDTFDVTQHNHKTETLCKPVSESANATRSPVVQSNFYVLSLNTCVSDARPSPGLINSKSFKQNISSCSSPQSFVLNTCSKRNITDSDVDPKKAGTLLKDNVEKDSDSLKQIHKKLEFIRGAERQTVLDNSTHKPGLDTNRDYAENCPLTASQKADVTELCNLLEEADSQYEFTQLKPKKFASDSHTAKKEWDPNILNGIDFDDSFNSDVLNGNHQTKMDASTINSSSHRHKEHECASVQIVDVDKLCNISKEILNEVPFSKTEHNLVDGMNIYFGKESKSNCFGFKTATGKVISISEMNLNKAKQFFEEHDEKVSYNRKDNKAETDVLKPEQSKEQAMVFSANTSECMDKKYIAHFQLNQDANEALNVNEKVVGDAETEQNCLDGKTDVVCFNTNSHFGFSTARGKQLNVSQTALEKARKLLNDVDSFEASEPQELIFHTSGIHADSMSATTLQKTKAVSWHETSVNINQSDSEKINQATNVTDIPFFECKNFIQEQKSGNDAKGNFTNICPPKTCQPLSVHGYGFQTASGKEVSAEALEKSKTVFKDCDENVDCLEAALTKEKNDKLHFEILKQTNGFKTTSGTFFKVVHEEAKAVCKDSDLINELCDEANERSDFFRKTCQGNRVHDSKNSSLDQQPPQEEGCEQTAKECNKDLQNNFFKDASEPLNSNCGFTTASGKEVSVLAESLQRAKDVLNDSVDVIACNNGSRLAKQSVNNQTETSSSGNHNGFSTAGRKKVTVSATALERAEYLFKDCEEKSLAYEDLQNQSCLSTATGKEVTVSDKELNFESVPKINFSLQNGQDGLMSKKVSSESSGEHKGFCTAGGKKVAISATALQRAKTLFKECEDEGLTSEALQNQNCKGFSTATVSEKALHEVKAAGFVDSSFSHESKSNASGCHKSSCEKSVPSETVSSSDGHRGFCTAGGKKVTVSTSALQRAKSLFHDCDKKVQTKAGRSHATSEDIGNENPKFDQNYGFSTASGDVPISKVALEEATKLFRDCDVQQVNDTVNHPIETKSHQDPPIMLDRSRDEESKTISHPTKVVLNEPAQLDLHSLDFNSCTETQQEYFEQEAMACTKALLADDDLNEPPGLVPSASPSVHDLQTPEQNRKKRQLDASSIEDSCQPPLKRQLSEFDQTVACAKSSVPTPVKSFPSGSLKARRVFRYSVCLQPNVTHSNQNSNDCVQHSSTATFQKRKPAVFVPPFKKNKPDTSDGQDASKVSSGFIPPFGKDTKDDTCHSDSLIKNPCESKPQVDSCTTQENTMTNSTPSTHSIEQYCGENDQHGASGTGENILVANIPLKNLDSEERGVLDTEACQEIFQLARDMQDMRLRKKKRQTIRPLPGRIYLAKNSGVSRISLRDAVGHKCPVRYCPEELNQHGVHHKVSQITSENAESFRFDCKDFFKRDLLMESGAVQLADEGWLVPDSKGTVGKEEFCRAMYDTPGVDPKLISDAWVFNHYRWIVWKRASMEKSFPDLMGSLCLTPAQVLLQLKFRYDVEVDRSQRPSLRRIMERDDTPAKTLVLCVCGVVKLSNPNVEKLVKTDDRSVDAKKESTLIWLTDGWYAIKGLLDLPLSTMLNNGQLRIGDKVVINGAELVGSQEACPPLEAPESLMLKISANSTRRVRWDTKLGYYRDPRPFRLPLSSLFAAGGVVSCGDVVLLRSYPTQWMEKKPNGVFIFRNDRAEDREARIHSNSKHKTMELLISKIQAQIEKEMEGKTKSQGRKRTFSRHEIEALQDGEELYEAMECDPAVETHLSERQMEAVSKFTCCLGEIRQAELQERVQKAMKEAQEAEGGCPDRDVTSVWKLSVVDANDMQSNCVYTLNIWRPSADLYSLLKEGHRYRVYHLATSESKKRSGVANIQLTATKKTLFRDVEVTPEWLRVHFHARVCVSFRELQNPQFISPCGEVDIVGYIISVVDKQGNSPVLHLMDEKFDLVSVRTSGSLEQLAVEELVKPRALVALSNLQLRQLSGPVPCLYAGEQALFSINPKESHLQEAMVHLKSLVQTCEEFFSIAEEKMSNIFPSGVSGSFQSPRIPDVSNPKMNGWVTPQQKGRVFSPFTPVSTSNCETKDPKTKDPKSVKRKRGLVYLSRIPSPPPLTPLKTKASPCVNKTFNPPRRSVTPKPPEKERDSPWATRCPPGDEELVPDEELVMIDTQALLDGLKED
ncbi:breast cancer type 2 susceptibility protein [Triplophysa rosa]|uniref:Breast cancer type 2 susceptibility protein n=1 Tax=Triplophysa rosa TaxID=992332 RepID=A0A9W7TPD4_TRIRA|nr:breast cancer type 2 susceptibility protein [Triplophysa rosa]